LSEDKLVRVILAVRDGLSQIVEQLNGVLKEIAPETGIPKVDLAEIAELPWISYKTKQPCASASEPGWIFNDPSKLSKETQRYVFDELVKTIEGAGGKIQLGDMLFTFSGPPDDKKMFISRRPASKKSNPGPYKRNTV